MYGSIYFLLTFAVVQVSVAYSGHHTLSHHPNLRDNKYDIKMSSGTKTREEAWKKHDGKDKNKEGGDKKKITAWEEYCKDLEKKNKNK